MSCAIVRPRTGRKYAPSPMPARAGVRRLNGWWRPWPLRARCSVRAGESKLGSGFDNQGEQTAALDPHLPDSRSRGVDGEQPDRLEPVMLHPAGFGPELLTRRVNEAHDIQALHRNEEVDALYGGVDRDFEFMGPLGEPGSRPEHHLIVTSRG